MLISRSPTPIKCIVETDNYVPFLSFVDEHLIIGMSFEAMGDDDQSGGNVGGVARPLDLKHDVTLAAMAVLVIVAGSVGKNVAIEVNTYPESTSP